MMAALNAQLDIQQILQEAQHRWLRPAEICEILLRYKNFRIASEPPNRPPSGSLFLFDRKVLRYFRKDGHNWRKKRDGKTVKEAHERLKAGSVDVLHCYYAHGEDDESFQRRSYWMLDEELSHIVLVHYREIKVNRTNFSRLRASDSTPDSRRTEEDSAYSEVDSSGASRFQSYDYQGASQATDTASRNTSQVTEREDAESEYRHQGSPGQSPTSQVMEAGSVPYHAVNTSNNYQRLSSVPIMNIRSNMGTVSPTETGFTHQYQNDIAFQSWQSDIASSSSGYQTGNFQPTFPPVQSCGMRMMTGQENELLDQVVTGAHGTKKGFESNSHDLEKWQASDCDSLYVSNWSVSRNAGDSLSLGQDLYCPSLQQSLLNQTPKRNDVKQVELSNSAKLLNAYITELGKQLLQDDLQLQGSNAVENSVHSYIDEGLSVEDTTNHIALKQPLLDGVGRADLKKLDSFDRLFKELGDVAEPSIHPGCGMYWEIVGSDDEAEPVSSTKMPLDNYILSPSISQDQLFSIVDFSPSWAYSEFPIKVLVMGRFLTSQEEVVQYKWACMFGEHEAPAEVVEDGVLQCYSPLHGNGRVPFYVTCSNRLACSEVREFDFRSIQNVDVGDIGDITYDETHLHMRFRKMLSLGSDTSQTEVQISSSETSQFCTKISAMLNDDSEWEQMLNFTKQDDLSTDKVKDQLPENFFKEKLHVWLLQKIAEGGKGPSILDEGGQGILHFAAALGYDWAIRPTIAAGVSVNFRDANGWTALHWAAYNGRERTVGFLISLGAAPGFVTDPTPQYPSGRSPADLASSNGHKGIGGYLAESSLSSHLSSITLNDTNGTDGGGKAVETVSDRIATPLGGGDLPHGLSLKDSLAAVRNATQAAARIYQVYRVQSFQRKQLKEYSADREFGISDARALSLLAPKSKRATQHYEPVHAAVQIQNKFRSWKGRKDYLLIRQKIIKIQAHVRGHQVRKNYRTIIWSVGILDKVILRWRRKGKGLSGFKRGGPGVGTSKIDTEKQEDDYDFLIEGRKQTEERLHKTLARVKSMVQYPEARDQYRRVLNVVSEMQEKMATYDKNLNNPEDDHMVDIDTFLEDDTFLPWLEDDTFMPIAP